MSGKNPPGPKPYVRFHDKQKRYYKWSARPPIEVFCMVARKVLCLYNSSYFSCNSCLLFYWFSAWYGKYILNYNYDE